jgi:F-type H+-transporting ATPase subunit b
MDETLRQLGGLLLGSIPTIVLFLVLFVAYRSLVHAPLERVLSERHSKTEGALDKARADIAAAEAKTAEYEKALREARLMLFKAQEQRRQKAAEARARAAAQARSLADEQVRAAKAALEKEVAASKLSLQAEGERLATEVIQSIFKQVGAVQAPATGGQ